MKIVKNILPHNTTIKGDNNNNNLKGSVQNDFIYGFGGNDIIDGGRGNDFIEGNAGNDRIYGGSGNDTIYGDNSIFAFSNSYGGNDYLFGGLGNDTIYGGGGNDKIWGGSGDDKLYGGSGTDVLFGESGNDKIDGGLGNDYMYGGSGSNTLIGGAGNDHANFGERYVKETGTKQVADMGSGDDKVFIKNEKGDTKNSFDIKTGSGKDEINIETNGSWKFSVGGSRTNPIHQIIDAGGNVYNLQDFSKDDTLKINGKEVDLKPLGGPWQPPINKPNKPTRPTKLTKPIKQPIDIGKQLSDYILKVDPSKIRFSS